MTAEFVSSAIHCNGCVRNVQSIVGRAPGVKTVAVDLPTHRVRVDFDEAQTNREKLADLLATAGYPPDAGKGA